MTNRCSMCHRPDPRIAVDDRSRLNSRGAVFLALVALMCALYILPFVMIYRLDTDGAAPGWRAIRLLGLTGVFAIAMIGAASLSYLWSHRRQFLYDASVRIAWVGEREDEGRGGAERGSERPFDRRRGGVTKPPKPRRGAPSYQTHADEDGAHAESAAP